MPTATRVLVLGTADWNQAIATNQHYMTRELAKRPETEVTFVESMGLRRPQLSRRDLGRILRRISSAFARKPRSTSTRAVPSSVRIVSPLGVPLQGRVAQFLNRHLLDRLVADWLRYNGPRVLWTYTPITLGYEKVANRTMYHCVDLLGEFPGIDRAAITSGEQRLASRGARAAASSAVVRDHLLAVGFDEVLLWENVADVEALEEALPTPRRRIANRIIFVGNITPAKVDFPLLERLASDGHDVRIAGPLAEGGGRVEKDLHRLLASGVTHLGMLNPAQLAHEMASCTVGLIPYLINEYTEGVSPLKTYEYMIAGLAVVSTALPGVTERDQMIVKGDGHDEFSDAVRRFAAIPSETEESQRMRVAREHSWSARGRVARETLDAELENAHGSDL